MSVPIVLRDRSLIVALVTAVALVPFTGTARAADDEPAARTLEEIVVTARRREESLQDVPTSVSVISSEEILGRGEANFDVIGQIVPNVHFESAGGTSGVESPVVFVRGMGQADFIIVEDPAVGLYLDGVFMGRMVGQASDLVDVERIEVLRGPQGTLFGRNTIGGAINIVSKKPDDEFGASIKLAAGEDGHIEARGTVNVPLNGDWGARLSAFGREMDGYVDALQYDGYELGSEDIWGTRLMVSGTVGEQFSVDFSFDYSKDTSTPGAIVPLNGIGVWDGQQRAGPGQPGAFGNFWNVFYSGDPGSCLTPGGQAGNQACYGPVWNAGRYETNSVFTDLQGNQIAADQDIEVWGTNLTLGVDFEAVSLKSITSYREFDIFLFNDLDFSPHIVFANTHPEYSQEQFSQELQLTGAGIDNRLNYVVGAYYFKEDGVEDIFNQIAHVPAISAGPPTNFFQNLARHIDNESWALYGQLTFDITEALHLTVGTRYTESEKDFVMITERVTGTTVQPGLLKTREHTPMASLSYDVGERSMVYFTYSEGYRDGGFPARFTGVVPIPLPNYEPEFVENYEVGYKTTLLDGRLRANVAAFLMEYTDMQISATSLLPNVGDNTTKFNLGDATYTGFEIELTALVTDNFTLGVNVGHLDDEIDSLVGGGLISSGILITEDHDLPFSPSWTLAITAAYDFALPNGAVLTLRGDYSAKDDFYTRTENTLEAYTDDYKMLNAGVTYRSPDENWSLGVRARNLTNEFFFESRTTFSAFQMGFGKPVRPRTVSAFFTYDL
ncbi:MAG: TonB-dependent receptor [Gammaproteobacteria bacterium]|nr:TonB-dependent receptor [Gammaproteobacteria bacterium]